jgi:hypothetical protein
MTKKSNACFGLFDNGLLQKREEKKRFGFFSTKDYFTCRLLKIRVVVVPMFWLLLIWIFPL